jgi:hypothetical protein
MLDAQQLAEIEHYMREEHRKDIEALERLKRYLPDHESAPVEGPLRGREPGNIEGKSAESTTDLTEFLYQHEV